MKLIVWWKSRLAFFASENTRENEEVDLSFELILNICWWVIIIEIWILFMIIFVVLVVWFLHFLLVFFDYVNAFFILIISLIFAFNFTKCRIWRVCVVFNDYVQRLFRKWQNKSEFWKFFLEISRIWRKILIFSRINRSRISILIFWTIVLTCVELLIKKLITWINILILIWEKKKFDRTKYFE
jgi:hypothetical protein